VYAIPHKEVFVLLPDIEIARKARLYPIDEIAQRLGLREKVIPFGHHIGKIPFEQTFSQASRPPGKLVLVTAMNPTPAGEGKTTTSIGLSQALNYLGKSSVVTLREPSLGPVFGVKGGAAGGGYSQVVPMEEINLHFTGDIHAVTSAHNLLSALIDAHIKAKNELGIIASHVFWPRVMDMNDRALRQIVVGLGGVANGVPREDAFRISASSEVMAVLCLAQDYADLKERLGRMLVARSNDRSYIHASDLQAQGAMSVLLKTALLPNLVQTLENTPALIHGGPFANIAHGTNSILATKLGMQLSEYTITEAGFGAELGAEKFLDFVCQVGDFWPSAVVLVATIRAMKMHGGVSKKNLDAENLSALEKGWQNLQVHIQNLRQFGLPVVVALNHFPGDTKAETRLVRDHVEEEGARFSLSQVWAQGGKGGTDLAQQVMDACNDATPTPNPLYDLTQPIPEKIALIAKKMYRAQGIAFSPGAKKHLRLFTKDFCQLPVIIAKTQSSLSHDPSLLGAPKGYVLPIQELSISAGAGFVVAYAGDIMTMPGLSSHPAALDMDLDNQGNISGLF